MKLLPFFLFLATFAVVDSSKAQGAGAGEVPAPGEGIRNAISVRRSTPTPSPGAAAASGPKKGLEATLSKDGDGKEPATVFTASTPKIYLHYTDDSATKGEKFRAVWIAEDAVGISTKNKTLTEAAATAPGPGLAGSFYLPAAAGGFPVGKYRVELYDGGKLSKSVKFTVKK